MGTNASRHRGFMQRNWRLLVGGLVAASLALAGCGSSKLTDGEMRDTAVAAYTQQLSQDTSNGIAINVKKNIHDYDPPYYWNGSNHTLRVNVRLGSCPNVVGTFVNVPKRPANASQLGEVLLTLPNVSRGRTSAQVSARAPNLYASIMASSLALCIAGDSRFTPAASTTPTTDDSTKK